MLQRFRDELGDWRVVIHSPYGAAVHAPWALAIAARLRETTGLDPQVMHADDGIVLRLPDTQGDEQVREVASALVLEPEEVEQVVTDGHMRFQPVEGSEQHFPAQMVFLAMGFTGPEQNALVEQFGVDLTDRGNVARDDGWATNVDGVFVAGDMGRGQSLIVWAIAEGRSAAAAVDTYLMTSTDLPAPIVPTAAPMR